MSLTSHRRMEYIMKKNTCALPISTDEMKSICDEAFSKAFPEVVAVEKIIEEKGKITDSDLKRVFNIK